MKEISFIYGIIFQDLGKLKENKRPENTRVVDVFDEHYQGLIFFGMKLGAKKEVVEDAIQDLFTSFCENEDLILNAHNQEAYLKASLKRKLLKKADLRISSLDGASRVLEISVPSYEETLIKKQSSLQDALAVKNALALLSNSQKTIMTMRFFRGMSYEDIAEKLSITKRTVYNQVHDAMKRMRTSINE